MKSNHLIISVKASNEIIKCELMNLISIAIFWRMFDDTFGMWVPVCENINIDYQHKPQFYIFTIWQMCMTKKPEVIT